MVDFAVNPRKLALVNVDSQIAFVEGTPASPPDGPAGDRGNSTDPEGGACHPLSRGTLSLEPGPMSDAGRGFSP